MSAVASAAAVSAAMAWAIWVAAALPAVPHGDFHGGRFAHNDFHHGRRVFAGGPFFDDYGYYDYGSNCWRSERIHTPAGWRWRNV